MNPCCTVCILLLSAVPIRTFPVFNQHIPCVRQIAFNTSIIEGCEAMVHYCACGVYMGPLPSGVPCENFQCLMFSGVCISLSLVPRGVMLTLHSSRLLIRAHNLC